MKRALFALLATCTLASCATARRPEASTPNAQAVVLRLLDITPPLGARADSGTVLVARLAYQIPNYDSARAYTVAAMFASTGGGSFSEGGGDAAVRSAAGIVTVRYSMATLWSGARHQAVSPLTGTFFLLEHDPMPIVHDSMRVGDRDMVRTVTRRTAVRARSRTFYYNGTGPAQSFARTPADLLEEYWTFKPHKAFALAYDAPGRWTYGYAYGFVSREAASERALQECRKAAERRKIASPCKLSVIDDDGVAP